MKSEKEITLVKKCELFSMTPTQYYKLCYKYKIDGKVRSQSRKKHLSEDEIEDIIATHAKANDTDNDRVSDMEEYSSNQDDSE